MQAPWPGTHGAVLHSWMPAPWITGDEPGLLTRLRSYDFKVRLAAPEGFSTGRAAPARTQTRGRWQPISGLLFSIIACMMLVMCDYATYFIPGQFF
jgi:hypothetical protein